MRWLIVLALLAGAILGYVFYFADHAEAPPPPPPPAPVEISVGTLTLTLDDWRIATATEAANIKATLEDPAPRRSQVLAFLERTLRGYAEMIDPEAMGADALAWIRESGRPYELDVTGDSFLGTGGRSSYRLKIYYNTGGAHPNGSIVAETYGADGKRLSLADVIGADRPLERLAAAARPRLLAEIEDFSARYGNGETYEPGEDFDAGTAPSPENYQNWYLSGDDVVVVFNTYQVGPYVLGSHEIAVPLAELAAS